jgi:hypothetical protein
VKLTGLVPWELLEARYAGALAQRGLGAPPLAGRVAFWALIIKERLGVTGEEINARTIAKVAGLDECSDQGKGTTRRPPLRVSP